MKITFIFSCSGMFRDVPECSVFLVLSTPDRHILLFDMGTPPSPRQVGKNSSIRLQSIIQLK